LINGFKALGLSPKKSRGQIRADSGVEDTGGGDDDKRESFEFILITLTNASLEEALTNYLPEYDCAEFLTKDRPSLSHDP